MSLYSLMVDPMTTCGCCECIAAILPMCNAIMTVDRDFTDMTPCGMKFTSLAGSVGGGAQVPGFPDLPDMIADETVAKTEDEVLEYITQKGHPCLGMEDLL